MRKRRKRKERRGLKKPKSAARGDLGVLAGGITRQMLQIVFKFL